MWDQSFLRERIREALREMNQQQDFVRQTLIMWLGNGDEVWKWGLEHMHQIPEFQQYEYLRVDLHTMHLIVHLTDERLIRYHESPRKKVNLDDFFRPRNDTKAERRALFEDTNIELSRKACSLDRMVEIIENWFKDGKPSGEPTTKTDQSELVDFVSQLPVALAGSFPPEALKAASEDVMHILRQQ